VYSLLHSLAHSHTLITHSPTHSLVQLSVTRVNALPGQSDEGEVVAIGTGSTCVSPKFLDSQGRTLFDSHAEVVARRALLK
jgi:hypothetical protein